MARQTEPKQTDINDKVQSILSQRDYESGNVQPYSKERGLISKIGDPTKSEKYQQFQERLDFLQGALKDYMQKNYRHMERKDVQREVVEHVPEQSLGNYVRKLFGKELKLKEVRTQVIDTLEYDAPLNEGTVEDLQLMVKQAADTLDSYNKSVIPTVKEIDAVTKDMRRLQKECLDRVILEKRSFHDKDTQVGEYMGVLQDVKTELDALSILDPKFSATYNNHDDLENLITKLKYEMQSHHTNTLLFINQKTGLRVYERCLEFAKYTTEQLMNYTNNFTTMVRHLNISVGNVHLVCEYLSKTFDTGAKTVELINASQSYLAGMIDVTKSLYEDPVTKVVDERPFMHQIDTVQRDLNKRLDHFRQEQEKVEQMVKLDRTGYSN